MLRSAQHDRPVWQWKDFRERACVDLNCCFSYHPQVAHSPEQLIDFIRVHISAIGGITPARKLAALCEAFGVRTAWHGPGDVSPVGHAANVHLDLHLHNFGIQEFSGLPDPLPEVFPGCPELRDGYLYVSDRPGLGIDINESLAAQYPLH
jgi:mannonate dehydratase